MGGIRAKSARLQNELKIIPSARNDTNTSSKKANYYAPSFLDRLGLALLLTALSVVAVAMWSKNWDSQLDERAEGKKE